MQAVAARGATKPGAYVAESGLDFAELFQHYYPRVYNYLRYRLDSVDSIQPITVEITIDIRIDDLVPGVPPAGDHEDDGDDDKRNGDHNRGHGNDDDHHDEDNPGHDD